jgi:phospholipid transport system substrate-binding protein
VVVRTEIRGRGDPIQLDSLAGKRRPGAAGNLQPQRAGRLDGGNLSQPVRAEINAKGVEGLIATLAERSKSLANGKKG